MLVCRGTGQIMNHDNPPVALPNGQVVSPLAATSFRLSLK